MKKGVVYDTGIKWGIALSKPCVKGIYWLGNRENYGRRKKYVEQVPGRTYEKQETPGFGTGDFVGIRRHCRSAFA